MIPNLEVYAAIDWEDKVVIGFFSSEAAAEAAHLGHLTDRFGTHPIIGGVING